MWTNQPISGKQLRQCTVSGGANTGEVGILGKGEDDAEGTKVLHGLARRGA